MKKIFLTQGKFALVDDIDYEYLSQWKWYFHGGYAVRKSRKHETGKRKMILMHRVILNKVLDPDSFVHTDHKNQDKLDNCRDNLRPASRSQNGANRKLQSGSSKFKGVRHCKRQKKWLVEIQFESKCIHLGYFDNEIEAAKAYNKAALKYFGEFAYLNDI